MSPASCCFSFETSFTTLPSASSSRTWAASSRPRSPTRPTQPPRWKPSSPAGSWMTPSSETFSLMMIFPISVLLWLALSATTDAGAAAPGKWAPANRPVRPSVGAYTRWKCGKVREEGDGEGGDSRPDLTGAGRGRRRVPRADRAVPSRAPGALLLDARILPGRRGRPPGHAAGRLAKPRSVRETGLAAHLAVPDRHQPVPRRAPRGQPAPGHGVGRAWG